jgi:tRNA (guanosine-2'-O-)-methyltransferase
VSTPRRSLSPTELKRLHRGWRRRTEGRVALLLDGVQNPFNLGSIARTAAALRVERAWLTGTATDLAGPKFQKTALGTDRLVRWEHVLRPAAALAAARDHGYRLVGVELGTGSRPLFDLDLAGDVCLVVGHEERGLSNAAFAECDDVGFVPLLGRVGSLNVASATAIALYEVRRQEWTTATAHAEATAHSGTADAEATAHSGTAVHSPAAPDAEAAAESRAAARSETAAHPEVD